MDKEKLLNLIRENIEINKKKEIEEIEKEHMIPAMWSVSTLIDLKAQEELITKIIEAEEEKWNL